jgi:2-oxoisovalerate dehydrogenase E1 component
MKFDRKKISDERLKELFVALLTPRMIEEKMLILLRQNKSVNGLVVLVRKRLP